MRFLVVAAGRNHPDLTAICLDSIAAQKGDVAVCLVDDASNDPRNPALLSIAAEDYGWTFIQRAERHFPLANQVAAWRALSPKDDDVVVFVDLDDRLAHDHVFEVVARYYERGAWLTYGSYEPEPASDTLAVGCVPAQEYPPEVVRFNLYRSVKPYFNHLRTVSWRVLKHLTEEDLRDDFGNYWQANADASVMLPCLELAADRAAFVSDILYKYTCNNPDAVWRTQQTRLNTEWRQLRARKPKEAL